MTTTFRRLSSAALLCIALVLSQMAHAVVPQGLDAAPTISPVSMYHAAERRSDAPKPHDHSGGAADMKCASHCPVVFVSPMVDPVWIATTRSSRFPILVARLTGSAVPAPDEPPRG